MRLVVEERVWGETVKLGPGNGSIIWHTRSSSMHPRQVLLHLLCGKHVDVLDTHWLKDVFLKVVIQPESANSLDKLAGPVDVDAVFPLLTRLVDKRLAKVVPSHSREFIQASLSVIVVET